MSDHRALQIVPQPAQTSSPESSPLREPAPQAKYIEACKRKAWALHLWRKAERPSPSNRKILRYRCRSWRHEGPCNRWRASVDWRRIVDAFGPHPIEDIVFLVLTFPSRNGSRKDAYKTIWRRWQSLRQAIARGATLHRRRRSGGRRSVELWTRGAVAYVATVEQHRDGWPHLNVIMLAPEVARAFRERRYYAISWMKQHAKDTGWGYKNKCRLWAEPARDKEKLATYILKCAGRELGRMVGEVTKLSQAPVCGPHRFRRIRYSRGFLAVRHKDPAWTGQLERYPLGELADRLAHWDAVNARCGWSEAPEDARLADFLDPAHRPRGPPVTFFLSLSQQPRALRVRYWTLRRQLGLTQVPRLRKRPGLPWGPLPDHYE